MRVSILLQIINDDGACSSVEEVAAFEKATKRAEDAESDPVGRLAPVELEERRFAAVAGGNAKVLLELS